MKYTLTLLTTLFLVSSLAMSQSAKKTVTDSTRTGKLTVNGQSDFNGEANFADTTTFNHYTLLHGPTVITNSVTAKAINADSATHVNARATINQIAVDSSATVAVDSSLAAADTLNVTSSIFTRIKVRGKSGAVDSVDYIKGAVAGNLYMFQPVADDTSIVFPDAGQFRLGASRTLDALGDILIVLFDGTSFYEVFFGNND